MVPRFGITDDTFGTSLFLERGAGCFWEPKFSELGTRGSKIESIDANVRSKTKWDVNALFGGPLSKTTKTYFKHVYVDSNAYVITFSNVIVEIKIGKSVAPRLRALMRTFDQEQHAMYYVSVLFGGPLSKTTKTHFKHVC